MFFIFVLETIYIKLDQGVPDPLQEDGSSVGLELYSNEIDKLLAPMVISQFHTGILIRFPKGTFGMVMGCSSGFRNDLLVLSQTVDYVGEIVVNVINMTGEELLVKKKEKVAELVVMNRYKGNFKVVSFPDKTNVN